jgi:GTP-binding protein
MDHWKKPVIAVVGRPNVGKSTLFNKLVGRRKAIVEDTPGVTRDLNVALCTWRLRTFTLIDTAGFADPPKGEATPERGLAVQMRQQLEIAVTQADYLLFMLDGRAGLLPEDEAICAVLRKSGKPLYCLINKTEGRGSSALAEFSSLGFSDYYPISSEHNFGIAELLDVLHPHMSPEEEKPTEVIPRIMVLGRPNVGKSTLINALLRETRMITSSIPGTTRDPIDSLITHGDRSYCFVDTAGIRKRGKIEGIEYYSVTRAKTALERADLALLLIDGEVGITEQDTKIAGMIGIAEKGLVIVVSKSDLLDAEKRLHLTNELKIRFSFLRTPEVVFISAQDGKGLGLLFKHVDAVYHALGIRVSTGDLNRFFAKLMANHPPPLHRGRHVRVYYLTQASVRPPTFVLFVNAPEGLAEHYLRYVDNQLRTTFGFGGAPIKIRLRQREGKGGAMPH